MKWRVLTIVLAFVATFLVVSVQSASAFDLFKKTCTGSAASSPACQQANSQGGSANRVTGTGNIIRVASNILAAITGIAAVIVIIFGGIALITSGGNTEAVTTGRRRIVAAIVGLVIVALAWTITRFITDNLIK